MALLRSSIYILWYPNNITDALDRMYLCTWLTWCPNHVMFGNFGSVGLWNTRLLSIFGLIQWNLDRVVQHSLCYPNHTQWTKTVMIMVHRHGIAIWIMMVNQMSVSSACRRVSGGVIWMNLWEIIFLSPPSSGKPIQNWRILTVPVLRLSFGAAPDEPTMSRGRASNSLHCAVQACTRP